MARKKKSLPQNVVGVATTGMPSPVRKFLAGRAIALLIVVIVPILFATGVISVRFENGRPKVTFNAQRAVEVREDAVDKVQDIRRSHGRHDTPVADFAENLGVGTNDSFGERVDNFTENVGDSFEQDRGIGFVEPEQSSGFHPFAKLKEQTDKLRR